MIEQIFRWLIDHSSFPATEALIQSWPPIDTATSLTLLLSAVLLLLHAVLLRYSVRWGDRLSAVAIDRLQHELVFYAALSASPMNIASFATPARVESLAEGVQEELQSPIITLPMSQEAVRRAALKANAYDYYQHVEGFGPIGQELYQTIKAFDKQDRQLMSVFFYNRVLAYFIFALSIGVLMLDIQVSLTRFLPQMAVVWIGLWACTCILVALLWMDLRAIRFWRSCYLRATAPGRSTEFRASPHKVFDFFVSIAHSKNSILVNVFLAPFWEEIARAFMGLSVPIAITWGTLQVERSMGIPERALSEQLTIELSVLFVIFASLYSVRWFLKWHQYRYWEVERLKRKLLKLNKAQFLHVFEQRPLPPNFKDEYKKVCTEFWVITGVDYGKERETSLRRIHNL